MKRARVLKAAAALGTFTAETLAYAAKVSVATTRTVLRRDAAVFTIVEVVSTGRAGGQPHVYGVVEPAFSKLVAAVAGPDSVVPTRPTSLDAAYSYLTGRMVETDDVAARREYLHRARLALAKVKSEWPADVEPERRELHRVVTGDLVRVAELELAKAPDFGAWRDLSVRLSDNADALRRMGEGALAATVLSRFLKSRLQQSACTKAAAARKRDPSATPFHRENAQRHDLERAGQE